MSLLGLLENGLFALGQVLRFPVMALLWLCVISVCFMTGKCLMESIQRRRERQGFDISHWLKQSGEPNILNIPQDRTDTLPIYLKSFLQDAGKLNRADELKEGGLEHLVLHNEEMLRHSLNPSRMLIKVAPSLGLLGTLIPMGVSLASMAAGNLEAMAGQMVVAFTTTIIGLACGTGAYIINLTKQGWVNQLIREQRFLAERINSDLEGSAL